MDPELYNKCEQDYEQSCLNRQHDFDERQHRWELIQRQASISGDHQDQQIANHVDKGNAKSSSQEMQIDIQTMIDVPEQIREEPEPHENDTSMSVDVAFSPPAP
jgi:hypothetical protein